MSDADAPSPATARQLRTLRIRLAALLGVLVLAVVAVLTAVVIRLDAELRDEQNDAALLRQLDDVGRQLAFSDGELEPGDPTSLLGPTVAVGVRPDFDVFEIADAQDVWDEIPEPGVEQIDDLVERILLGLDAEIQDEVIEDAELVDLDRDDAIQSLLDDPTPDLVDEAFRVYLLETTDELGIELVAPIDVFGEESTPVSGDPLDEVLAAIADGDETGQFSVDAEGVSYAVRGSVLRDGPEVRGAIAAFVDLESSDAAHARFRNRILAVALALVAGAAFAAWWLAGRSIRPAARALGQQERFLAAAAHELRTPIAAIRATAEAPPGPDGAAPQLARVAELSAGASELTDNLLTLARMDADRMQLDTTPTRLDLLVESIVDDDSAFDLALDEVVVDGDVALLTRAIENLLRNARLHGGATAERPATVTVDAAGVTVADRGPGVDAGEREAIFERFRSGAASTGHGLGLPLAAGSRGRTAVTSRSNRRPTGRDSSCDYSPGSRSEASRCGIRRCRHSSSMET